MLRKRWSRRRRRASIRGSPPKPELLQAQQQSAQSILIFKQALARKATARVALIESIGLMPTVTLKVADLPEKSHLNFQTADSVGELITKALAQRPDLVAKASQRSFKGI
jgi:outer membrane protein TolC